MSIKKSIKKYLTLSTFIIMITAVLIGCGNNGSSKSITIQGSDTMVNLGQALAEKYMGVVNTEASIAVTGGGSGTGIAALINNNTDLAQSSRAITQDEINTAKNNGVIVSEFIIGQDGLAVAVNSNNPIEKLTVQQLKDIFTGQITNWSDLGWDEGGQISYYSRQSNSGTYVFFNENIMNGEDWAEGTMFMPGSAAISDAIQNDISGIGYFGVGYVQNNKALMIAISENDEYITPLIKSNVDTGLYPISRPLYFYTNGTPEGEVLKYLKWVISSAGQQVIGDSGFYSFTEQQEKINNDTFEKLGIE